MIYKLVRLLANIASFLTTRSKFHGVEKLPLTGGCIIASNHLGRLDVLLVYHVLNRNDIILVVAEKYRKYALVRWLSKQLDAIFIDRYHSDFVAMRKVLERLKSGGVFAVAPEGTRSRTEALQEGRQGPAYLASKAGVPIYPVGAIGTEDSLVKRKLKHLQRTSVEGWVGDPIYLPPLPRENRDQVLQQYTDEIMCQIAALLPVKYRGVYAEHPRLQEILHEKETQL
jgi:1-acyl-sn-glycerol-3-phosphate acyltransferase